MSYDPFDGVLLNDARPPVPGAQSIQLHLRVARRLAPGDAPSLDRLRARSQACRELLAQGLFPATLRSLGLDLGHPRSPHSLANVVIHLEAYLKEVEQAGFLEPDAALWQAVDLELKGERGLWIERTQADGAIPAGLRDLSPARLRALACVPGLGGATFTLATRKGGGCSGLFGSSQPLVDWFLDGLEQHGQGLPNELHLAEPEGWGSAPWAAALEGLFDGSLDLEPFREVFQRGTAEGPVDLLLHAAEQICAWLDEGLRPRDITVIHPAPHQAGSFLSPLLAAEGIDLQVRGGLLPLLSSEAWSPLWALLTGLQRLDPCAVAAGLRASRRDDLKHWADLLAAADQDGPLSFQGSFMHLSDRAKAAAKATWQELTVLRNSTLAARDWAARLETLAGSLRLPLDPEDFFPPLGLLKETWGSERWTFRDLLLALEAFLETARSSKVPRSPEGVRLVSPASLLDDWPGARATLVLDLSEGAWPARVPDNPDLDWNRKAAINRALLDSRAEAVFPLALQRFWLPRSEHGDQIPRTFQREAYAFNKALALTRERLVVLSPAADAEGRLLAQGPFWNALEGAAQWQPRTDRIHGRLRWLWEGRDPDSRAEARASAALARSSKESRTTAAPGFDHVAEVRVAWMKGQPGASPTALEGLARCPFRSLAERVWGLGSFDAASRLSMAVGILVHQLLEHVLRPYVGVRDWPVLFLANLELPPEAEAEDLLPQLRGHWDSNKADWLTRLGDRIPQEQWPQAVLDLEALLPNLAAALLADARALAPTPWELAFLDRGRLSLADAAKAKLPETLKAGWTRTLVDLEGELGPVDLDLGSGRSLAVAGKLDRIERWEHPEGLAFLRITDYKTSRKKSLDAYTEEGAPFASHLQMPLYMRLVEEALAGSVATAALLPLREEQPEPFTKQLGTLAADEDWRRTLQRNLAGFDTRLEQGDFPPTPGEHCDRCQLSALCGRPVDVTVDAEAEED